MKAPLVALLLDFISNLAWPATVVFIAVLFRTQIQNLVERIDHAKLPGIELQTTKRAIQDAVQTVEEVTSPEIIGEITERAKRHSPSTNEDRYSILVKQRESLENSVFLTAKNLGVVAAEVSDPPRIAWINQQLRRKHPDLVEELDAVVKVLTALNSVLADPSADIQDVNKLVRVAEISGHALETKGRELKNKA